MKVQWQVSPCLVDLGVETAALWTPKMDTLPRERPSRKCLIYLRSFMGRTFGHPGVSTRRRWSQPVNATLYLEGEMECALMGDRFHRGFTAAEKTELWDRWKRGESLKAIGRAFGKPSSSIYFLVAPHGGIRPAQRRRSRLALTLAEREVI